MTTISGTHSGTSSGTNTGDQVITLTGDVTGSGTGSFATTIGAGAVTNSMLAGSIAAAKLVGTDIVTVGTITTGVWTGTAVAAINGGTAQTTYATGDILYASAANTLSKLPIGSANNQFLRVFGGIPSWQTPAINITGPAALLTWTTASITNLSAGVGGALTATLASQAANVFLAGPTSGASATPTFRAITTADLPSGVVTSIDVSGGTTGLTTTGGPVTGSGTITLTGTLVVGNGGTGAATLTSHGILLGQSTSAIVATAAMTAGQLLIGQGATSDPLPKTVAGDVTINSAGTTTIGAVRVTNAMLAGSITAAKLVGTDIATVGTLTGGATGAGFTIGLGTSTITGILGSANGGTGKDTSGATDGQILIGKTSDHSLNLATITGTSNRLVVTNAGGTITLNVSTSYAGDTSIVTVGTLTAGATGAGFTIDLSASTVSNRLPMANAPLTTDVYAWLITTAISFTSSTWATLVFNNESLDLLNEYDSTTGIFTPSVTGTYLITTAFTQSGGTGRFNIAVWTGTSSELQRIADGILNLVGGTIMINLTAATGYTIRGQAISQSGTTATVGQALTYLRIRRLS